MQFVALFRNLNLGQRAAPTRQELEASFLAAGAASARSFQTNGTLVFEAASTRQAEALLRRVSASLFALKGFDEPAFLRSAAQLQALVARQPFAGLPPEPTLAAHCVCFLHAKADRERAVPATNPSGDVRVIERTDGELLCSAYQRGRVAGNPNPFAEKLFGLPATTRVWGTLERLVAGLRP